MEYGRIIRVVHQTGTVETYVVGEPDKAKAVAIIEDRVASRLDRIKPIGRASLDLLKTMGLAAGQFAKA
jgi:hypothetical protein